MLMGSTKSLTPWDSNTWSPEPWPFSSIISPYWNPEQPPPCTNTRRPLPALFSSVRSSLIFAAAVSETLIMPTLYNPDGARGRYTRPTARGRPNRRAPLAGARHGAPGSRASRGTSASAAGYRHRAGIGAGDARIAAAVDAATLPRRQADPGRAGPYRRAHPAARAGAERTALRALRRARGRRRPGRRHAHSRGGRKRQHGDRVAAERLAQARSGGNSGRRHASRPGAGFGLARGRARGQPVRASRPARAVRAGRQRCAERRARRLGARLLPRLRIVARGGRSRRRPSNAALLVLRERVGAADLRVHLLRGTRHAVRHGSAERGTQGSAARVVLDVRRLPEND